jgi:hypothetical protein
MIRTYRANVCVGSRFLRWTGRTPIAAARDDVDHPADGDSGGEWLRSPCSRAAAFSAGGDCGKKRVLRPKPPPAPN